MYSRRNVMNIQMSEVSPGSRKGAPSAKGMRAQWSSDQEKEQMIKPTSLPPYKYR